MIHKLLARFDVFASLDTDELHEIANITEKIYADKGTHVFYHEEKMEKLFFVISGTVKIYRTDSDGNEQIVNFFQAGEMFPHHGLFRTDNYPASAVIFQDAILLVIRKNDFEDLLIKHDRIALKMFHYLGSVILDLQKRLQEKLLSSTDQQLLSLLERLMIANGVKINSEETKINIKMTKQEIGSMVGMTRETVSRNISRFKKLKILYEDDGYIIIRNQMLKKYL